jgi:hypothetical protein
MRDDANTGPRIPIPGTAGEAIKGALVALAMHPGEMLLTIKKERLPQGGYIYLISKTQPPGNG